VLCFLYKGIASGGPHLISPRYLNPLQYTRSALAIPASDVPSPLLALVPLKNALAPLFNAEKGVSTPSRRRISRGGARGRARGMPAGHGFLRATMCAGALARVGIVERRPPAQRHPSKPRGLQGPLRPATPGRPRLEFVGARGAASAAPASPLNAVGTLLLQRREVHPSHPLSVDHLPRTPSPSAQRGHESRRGPLGPHEVWHAPQSEPGEAPGLLLHLRGG